MATKNKNGRWQAKISLGKDNTGKYKYKYFYGSTEEEAESQADDYYNKYIVGNCKEITFENYAYSMNKQRHDNKLIGNRTFKFYEDNLRIHICPVVGNKLIADFTPKDIKELLQHCILKGLGDRMQVIIYNILNLIFKEAVYDEVLEENPMDAVRKPKFKKPSKRLATIEEFNNLLDLADYQMKIILIIEWFTGLREAEIALLKWDDIDLINKKIRIDEAYSRYEDNEIKGPKSSAGYRYVDIHKDLALLLTSYDSSSEYLFPSKTREFIRADEISKKFTKLARQLGYEGLTFHGLRHTHGTKLAGAGINAKAIQVRLGHSTASFTLDNYIHNSEELQKSITDLDMGVKIDIDKLRNG